MPPKPCPLTIHALNMCMYLRRVRVTDALFGVRCIFEVHYNIHWIKYVK